VSFVLDHAQQFVGGHADRPDLLGLGDELDAALARYDDGGMHCEDARTPEDIKRLNDLEAYRLGFLASTTRSMPRPLLARAFRQTRLRQDGLAAINRLNNPMRLHSTLGAPFGGYEANREIVTIYFSPDGSPDAVDSAGAVVISGGDCIISSSRRTWS
jgi:hypothetical protein